MKDRVDFFQIKTLIKKQWKERVIYPFKKGTFDYFGAFLKLLLIGVFIACFVMFFGKFSVIYSNIQTNNILDPTARMFEILCIGYFLILLFLIFNAISKINREFFACEDIAIFSAMPIKTRSLFVSKLLVIYLSQILISALCVLPLNLTLLYAFNVTYEYYLLTALMCFILPMISIAIGSIFVIPYNYIKQILKKYSLLNLIVMTVLLAGFLYLYYIVLSFVKDLLIGEEIKYFFSADVMEKISKISSFLYPCVWLANLVMLKDILVSSLSLLGLIVVCIIFSLFLIRYILDMVIKSKTYEQKYIRKNHPIYNQKNVFFAFVKKDFINIFRTPSYLFSYFVVALIMPLMIYFVMSVGSSLLVKVIGVDCSLELGVLMILLFGSLTNMFCSTNISREGEMFYIVKSLAVPYKNVFYSKIFLCMIVTTVSVILSCVVLCVTGLVDIWTCLFLILIGILFGFGQICIATKYDFNHAKFSSVEDGEIVESSGSASLIIVLGILMALIMGAILVWLRIYLAVRGQGLGYLTYVICTAIGLIFAGFGYLYFISNLKKKYYNFTGGNL